MKKKVTRDFKVRKNPISPQGVLKIQAAVTVGESQKGENRRWSLTDALSLGSISRHIYSAVSMSRFLASLTICCSKKFNCYI